MTLSTTGRILSKYALLASVAAMGLTVSSCNSWIFDEEGDCSVHYRLPFSYTANILKTEAFGSQVDKINLSIYDKSGKMVFHKSESRELTPTNDYYCDIDLPPGRYDILAWCEGKSPIADAVSFNLYGQNLSDALNTSGAGLTLTNSGSQLSFSSDLNRLYWGYMQDVEFPDTYGTVELPPLSLIKDTNHILVQLQNINGDELDPSALSFEIEGKNSLLNWQNQPTGTPAFVYQPWSVTSTLTTVIKDDKNRAGDSEVASGVQVEFTTSRLMANEEQILTVRQVPSGDVILRVPMVEYFLMVRSKYQSNISAQDYLDAWDDYSMVFFVDENNTWIKSRIFINGWRVVPKQDEHL